MLDTYDPGVEYDEMFSAPGEPRPHCIDLVRAVQQLSYEALEDARQRAAAAFLNLGITFTVYGETSGVERIFPFDLMPRVVSEQEWSQVEKGLQQRVLALNAFLQDVYNEQRIIDSGIVPADAIFGSPNYEPQMRGFTPPGGVWIHVSGIDLVRDIDGTLYVLEDNCRVPSGVSYVMQNRQITMRALPRLFASTNVERVAEYPNMLHNAVSAHGSGGPAVVLTPGMYNSAYFEHSFLAKQMGAQLVEGRDLDLRNGRVVMKTTRGPVPVGSIYRRVDDEFVDPLNFNPASVLGVPGLFDCYRAGGVVLANALGTGLADDKAIYPYVPEMIRFYRGEEPILPNVPTYRAADPRAMEYVLAHLRDLVVKPTNASGGYGVVVGPSATERELANVAELIRANPAGYVAQPLIRLSTCPTLVDGTFKPRRIDLRPFVVYAGGDPWVLPGGLTRVALR